MQFSSPNTLHWSLDFQFFDGGVISAESYAKIECSNVNFFYLVLHILVLISICHCLFCRANSIRK